MLKSVLVSPTTLLFLAIAIKPLSFNPTPYAGSGNIYETADRRPMICGANRLGDGDRGYRLCTRIRRLADAPTDRPYIAYIG